jgi:hypothetical protein
MMTLMEGGEEEGQERGGGGRGERVERKGQTFGGKLF